MNLIINALETNHYWNLLIDTVVFYPKQILKEKYSKINEVLVKGTHQYFGWYKGQLENAWYRCVWDIKQPRERETNWPWSFISATTSTLLTCYPFLENIYFGRDVDRFSSPWNIYNFFRNILAGPCTNTNTVQIQCAMMRNSENQNRNHKLKMLQKCTQAKEVQNEYQGPLFSSSSRMYWGKKQDSQN